MNSMWSCPEVSDTLHTSILLKTHYYTCITDLTSFQRTIQDLFEVEAGSGEKVEEFVVLHQEPSASEAISPRVARPYIQALHSINLDALPEEEQQQQHEEELAGKESKDNQEEESKTDEEPAQQEELNAVIQQVPSLFYISLGI